MFPVKITVPYVKNLEQRGYADMIEKLVAEEAKKSSPEYFHPARSKRSIEDFSYKNESTIWFDVKSFDVNSDFSMPNLVSIDRLRKVMADPSQEIIYILVDYRIDHKDEKVYVKNIEFRPIHSIDPSVLAIQNLGKGVLQVKNMHKNLDRYTGTRDEWMKEISKMALAFYGKQITKFQKMQAVWC